MAGTHRWPAARVGHRRVAVPAAGVGQQRSAPERHTADRRRQRRRAGRVRARLPRRAVAGAGSSPFRTARVDLAVDRRVADDRCRARLPGDRPAASAQRRARHESGARAATAGGDRRHDRPRGPDLPEAPAASLALGVAALSWLTAAAAFTVVEDVGVDGRIHSFFDALWWSTATITTVGYGDVYPVTVAGHIIGGFTMVVGISTLTMTPPRWPSSSCAATRHPPKPDQPAS